MAVVKRRGKWIADFRDAFGIRRWVTCDTKAAAQVAEAEGRLAKDGQKSKPTVDPDIRFSEYAAKFLDDCKAGNMKPKSRARYEGALRVHIVPRLGRLKVREIGRSVVKALLVGKLADGEANAQGQGRKGTAKVGRRRLARGTVKHLLSTLNAVFTAAVDDELLVASPLQKLGKKLNLNAKKADDDEEKPKALDAEQLALLMTTARETDPELYPALMVMGVAGLRIGEAIALTWDRLDLAGQKLRVDRQLMGTTKTRASKREVDMADSLRDVLTDLLARRREDAFRSGAPMSPWVLFPDLGEKPDEKSEARLVKGIRRRMVRVLDKANLPPWHTPHSLRHSFGSLMVSSGASLAYVKAQMGHASIAMTVDVYGSWLPKSDVAAVNRVFGKIGLGQSGSKTVAAGVLEAAGGR